MAYPDVYYKKRRANGEEIAGRDLHSDEAAGNATTLAERIVYGVTGAMLALVLARILLRLFDADSSHLGIFVSSLTDPYVWVFNSLFSSTPRLLLATIEPGSLVSIVFFPLLAWALLGLIGDMQHRRNVRLSRTK
jgi:hypothetical protein